MAEVVWLRAAIVQIDQIAAYVRVFDPAAADRLAQRLLALGDSLADFPLRGRPASNGAREMLIVRPYILRYRVIDDRVFILGIRHGAQLGDD
jgi:toxin ParE1/3/4